MSEPLKKVVSKKQYLVQRGKKLGFYALSAASLFLAGAILKDGIVHIIRWKSSPGSHSLGLLGAGIFCISSTFWGLFLVASAAVWSKRFLTRGKAIAPVVPLTNHNLSLIPPQDILVRSSEISQDEPQKDLLRAAWKGPETPPEQLLRAGQGGTG